MQTTRARHLPARPRGGALSATTRAAGAMLALALPGLSTAQSGAWATDTAAPGLGGRVFSFGSWRGEAYAGGYPFAAKDGEIACLARWDGTRWRAVGTGVDLVGGWAPFATPTVRSMCEFNGSLIVAGTFDLAGGQPRNNIARWNGTTFDALGQGLEQIAWDADIRALAVFQNELYATGTFDLAGGQPANGIARWNGTAWAPLGVGLGGFGAGQPGYGESLLVVGTELLVGGDFFYANGVPAQGIARWDGTTFRPMGAGFDGSVSALAEYGGRVIAGGPFSFSGTTPIYGIASWNGVAWQAMPGGPTSTIKALRTVGNVLYAGGTFTSLGPYVARFDGTSWTSVGGVAGVFSGSIPTTVLALGVHGTDLLVGGEFTRAGQPPEAGTAVVSTNVVAFDGSAWRQMGSGHGVHGSGFRMIEYRGDWLVVGAFDEIGGVAARAIARYDGDQWRRFATFDGAVENALLWNGDLIVSGSFTHIDGQAIAGMARFDGTTWTPFGGGIPLAIAVYQGQLYGNGPWALRVWNGTAWVVAVSVNGVVDDLHVHRDGYLYFTTAAFGAYGVHRFDGANATVIGTPNDFTDHLASFGNDLVVGGRFTAMGSTPTNILARWNGTAWSSLGSGLIGYSVYSTCELEGQLYAGVSGDPRGFLLRFNGVTWQAVPGGLDGLPIWLSPDRATSSVHAFGGIHSAGGKPVWNYGIWHNQPRWRNRLHGLAGAAGVPLLRGSGAMRAGTPFALTIEGPAGSLAALALGASRLDLPLFGGTLVPAPDLLLLLVANGSGTSSFATSWPAGVPAGRDVFTQAWLLDATGPQGFTATNALQCTTL